MIKITVTPPNKSGFVYETEVLSDAQDFLMLLREQGYEAARQSAQADGDNMCRAVEHFYIDDVCVGCGRIRPRR